ncbi:DUF4382 domain-containing protein [Psychroserpens ponticola]|uniref:DUF4382 domain-containing protein n=1 Tax=Psychroserpens ponticola TaxID=2932268 RepID=A0ABY7RXS4_9FLAO|nr:DUF4382 domain-containing protein [Psychroserpens ponticola]WCO01872.1 DUF4382 domain-containing protein [Psychroserpens ponticola]
MTFFYNSKTLLISLLAIVLFTSCTKEEDSSPIENSLVNVKLTGTQTQLSRLNLEILDVQLRVLEDETDPNAWLSLNAINTGIHDLTDFTDNQVLTLVDFEQVPAEFIYNIKLVLGSDNSVVKNNIEYVVDIESEYDNASVNILERQLVENKLYEFTIELNIDDSVQFSSQNEVKLNPKMNTLMRLYNLF